MTFEVKSSFWAVVGLLKKPFPLSLKIGQLGNSVEIFICCMGLYSDH